MVDMNKIGEVIKAAAADAKGPEIAIKINPELKDLLDKYENAAAREELMKSIEVEGVRDPIIIWKETGEIVDGHNRFEIAKELGKPVPHTEKSFPNIAAVKDWMLRNQLGRRNLTPARFNYYLGKLYNESKESALQTAMKTGETAPVTKVKTKIAEQFGVPEKTVERLGKQAKGIEMLAKVKGKLAEAKELSGKPEYTAEEKELLGSASNTTVAKKAIEKFDSIKKAVQAVKQEKKQVAQTVAAKATLYHVALVAPDFGPGYSVSSEPKPTLDKDAAVWMIVPDEAAGLAHKLIDHWGLTYEATIVFASSKTYDGVFTKIAHQNLFLATKGHIVGCETGKEVGSFQMVNGDIMPTVFKTIDVYHKANTRKIDMRRGAKTLAGWDSITKK